jgi:hypothetical protein
MTKSIFDLEQEIMSCWSVVEDIKVVYSTERLYENEDEMQNVLLGISALYQIKFESLFNTFEECVRNRRGTV